MRLFQFVRNLMYQFNLNATLSEQYITGNISNCIRLCQDLHALFDTKSFVLKPKHGVAVVHFLVKGVDYYISVSSWSTTNPACSCGEPEIRMEWSRMAPGPGEDPGAA